VEDEKQISEENAKTGMSQGVVSKVLAVSIVLALIAWVGLEVYGERTDDDAVTINSQ
jgi:hypothetical protein